MLELFTDPAAWASLITLALLEIVLGVDNVIFLSIITSRLPEHQQARARRIGLLLAMAGRIALLFALGWLIGLTAPFLNVYTLELSWRDIILIVGGLFLLYKATTEIHMMLEGENEGHGKPGSAAFTAVLVQIFMHDLVSSLDSVGSSCSWNMMVGTMSSTAARNVAVMVRRSLHYRLSEVMLAVRRLNVRHACSRSGILATSGIIALIVASLRINPDQLLNISSANWTKFAAVTAILTDVTVPAWNKYVICNLVILKANNALFLAFRSDFRAFTL